MEIRYHLFDAGEATWHAHDHVELIAVVNAHVRISRPNKYCINTTVAPFQIVKVTVYSVFFCHRIMEVAILHHHLRLNKTALFPLQDRIAVAPIIEYQPSTNRALEAPVLDVFEP